MSSRQKRQLDEQGYVLLEHFMGDRLLGELRSRIGELYNEEGDRAGSEFRTEEHAHRLANLADKGEAFRRAIVLPELLELVRSWGGDGPVAIEHEYALIVARRRG